MKKHIVNQKELLFYNKKAKKRLRFMVFVFFLLVASTFLILLLKPFNIYVILLDVSQSMSESMAGSEGMTKIDVAKESLIKFIEKSGDNDYFVMATFGPGNCKKDGLKWIEDNPDKCGGEILVSISNDKLQLYEGISDIQAKQADTHLSEGLFKVFNHLEKSLPISPGFKKIEVLIVGDGQDHCQAIETGNNVVLLPWSFLEKLRVNTIAVQVVDPIALLNFQTLASDGNGEYVDVYFAEEFYEKLKVVFPRGPTWILLIHLALAVIIFLLILLILRV